MEGKERGGEGMEEGGGGGGDGGMVISQYNQSGTHQFLSPPCCLEQRKGEPARNDAQYFDISPLTHFTNKLLPEIFQLSIFNSIHLGSRRRSIFIGTLTFGDGGCWGGVHDDFGLWGGEGEVKTRGRRMVDGGESKEEGEKEEGMKERWRGKRAR